MRDWLATLLQVSYSAKKCADDVGACVEHWSPLLRAVAKKRGVSVSQLLNDTLLRSLQMMDDIELSNEELAAVELPSKNDEMGSSLIESKLDDHTLAHCFSFLDTKDVCTSIERTSHRFLQASRNRKQPFYGEYLGWVTWVTQEDRDDAYNVFGAKTFRDSLENLIFSKPALPKPISLRSLRRFKIECIGFDPRFANESGHTMHTLDFMDVVKAVGNTVESCAVEFEYNDEYYDDFKWTIPTHLLSKVVRLDVSEPDLRQLSKMCEYFPKLESLRILDPGSADLSSLNNLRYLKSLDIVTHSENDDFFGDLEERRDLCLKPDSFPELNELSVDGELLPHFRPYLTDLIESLDLTMEVECKWDFSCNLSGLKKIRLRKVHDPAQCQMIRTKLNTPERIAEMTLQWPGNWQVLSEWVDCVNDLTVSINHDLGGFDSESSMIGDAFDFLELWSVKKCSLELSNPIDEDMEAVKIIIQHPYTQRCYFNTTLTVNGEAEGLTQEALDELEETCESLAHCEITVHQYA